MYRNQARNMAEGIQQSTCISKRQQPQPCVRLADRELTRCMRSGPTACESSTLKLTSA